MIPKLSKFQNSQKVILCFVVDIGTILEKSISCFLVDIGLLFMTFEISLDDSSGFFGARLFQN